MKLPSHSDVPLCDLDEPLRIGAANRIQNNLVHDAVDCGRRTDSQGQGEHHDDGEARRSRQLAKGIPDVLPKLIGPHPPACLPRAFLQARDISEMTQCGATRLVGVHSGSDVAPRLRLEVRTHLLLHLVFETRTAEQGANEVFHGRKRS